MTTQDNLQEADGLLEEKNKEQKEKTPAKDAVDQAVKKEADVEVVSEATEPEKEVVVENKEEEPTNASIKEIEDVYDNFDLEALTDAFEALLKNDDLYAIRPKVNRIKKVFNNKFSALLNDSKEAFLAEGGNSIDFNFTSPHKKKFNSLSRNYRERNEKFEKSRTQDFKKNLELRLQIIEEIKALINVNQNSNTIYNNFKSLQDKWRGLGKVPAKDANNVWNNYRHHVERFYDFLHLDRDLRDRDYKFNLEKKQKLIKSAEALANEQNLDRVFREVQALHKIWKEELGPVAKEHREALWEQFSAATKAINDKRKIYNAQIEEELTANFKAKEAIVLKINEIANNAYETHKDWQKQIKVIEDLRQSFFKLGSVPKKVRNQSWTDFKSAVRTFNKQKNNFYKFLKKDQSENLKKKKELVEIAEQNKDSEDLETTVVLMKNIQNKWKKIGHIPRSESSKLWKQFRSACNHFFDRYHEQKNAGTPEQIENLAQKEQLLETLKSFEIGADKAANLDSVKGYSKQWSELGDVPKNKRQIDRVFFKAVRTLLIEIGVSEEEVKALNYSNKLQELTKNSKAINNEINFVRKKIEDIKSEMNQLENNLQFFSNVADDNPMVIDVKNKIENYKSNLKEWIQKLSIIKKVIR
ncbi:MAG TPA: DUF349 domain-containing protein [Flavobacteriaceae bacterium]|nr:DUF349 domain-containing protein [Flavobacteriaceae bacterium]